MGSDQFSGANGSLNQESLHWSVSAPGHFHTPTIALASPRFPKLLHAPDSHSGQYQVLPAYPSVLSYLYSTSASGDSRCLEPTHVLVAPWEASHPLTMSPLPWREGKGQISPICTVETPPSVCFPEPPLFFSQIQHKINIFKISTALPNLME